MNSLQRGWETLDPYFFFSNVYFCVGGTKGNERDAAFKGKSDGKFTKFYVLCNLKISVLRFKHMAKDFTVVGPFHCFIFSILLFSDTEFNFFLQSQPALMHNDLPGSLVVYGLLASLAVELTESSLDWMSGLWIKATGIHRAEQVVTTNENTKYFVIKQETRLMCPKLSNFCKRNSRILVMTYPMRCVRKVCDPITAFKRDHWMRDIFTSWCNKNSNTIFSRNNAFTLYPYWLGGVDLKDDLILQMEFIYLSIWWILRQQRTMKR